MVKFIIIFTICSLINVMLNTAKTIIMYKNDRLSSALINAITFGFYTVVVVLMAGDMNLWLKVGITAITNFVGVWISMEILDRFRKDKLWKIEFTVKKEQQEKIENSYPLNKVPHSHIEIDNNYTLFNFYCENKKQTAFVKTIVDQFGAKYFISETKDF